MGESIRCLRSDKRFMVASSRSIDLLWKARSSSLVRDRSRFPMVEARLLRSRAAVVKGRAVLWVGEVGEVGADEDAEAKGSSSVNRTDGMSFDCCCFCFVLWERLPTFALFSLSSVR